MLSLTINGATELLPLSEEENAMRRYWEAKSSGDLSAHLMRLEDDPPAPEPVTLPTPISASPSPPTTPPGEISNIAAARIRETDEMMRRAGFAVKPPLFAPGTRVLPVGDANFRIERDRVTSMPLFEDAAMSVIETIEREDRWSETVSLRELTLGPSGKLYVGERDHFLMEPPAFNQLAQMAGFGAGARYLKDHCDPELRSANVNWQLTHLQSREVMLRTRRHPTGGRSIFAVVSPTYTAVDTDTVLAAMMPHLQDARVELIYNGTGVTGTALWMPDEIHDLAAGDVFKTGIQFHSNDAGRGRISISSVVFRNLCLNLLIIQEAKQRTASRVHRGDRERIVAALQSGVADARMKVADFLAAWGIARETTIDPAKTLTDWTKSKRIQVKGERDAAKLANIFIAAWAKEPGNTLADAVNAITRAAHEHTQWSLPTRTTLETQAAALVMA